MGDSRLGTLTAFLRPHRAVLARGFLLGLLANAVGLAIPLVAKWVLDSLGESASLGPPIVTLLGLMLVGTAIGLWQWIIMGTVAEQVVLDARTSIIQRYFAATVGAITRRPTGELVARVTSDATLLHDASASAVGLINSSLAMVATLVLMGFLDLVLLAVTLGAVVVVGATMATLMPAIAQAQQAAQESVGRLGGTLEGSLRAIRTVEGQPGRGATGRTDSGRCPERRRPPGPGGPPDGGDLDDLLDGHSAGHHPDPRRWRVAG